MVTLLGIQVFRFKITWIEKLGNLKKGVREVRSLHGSILKKKGKNNDNLFIRWLFLSGKWDENIYGIWNRQTESDQKESEMIYPHLKEGHVTQ